MLCCKRQFFKNNKNFGLYRSRVDWRSWLTENVFEAMEIIFNNVLFTVDGPKKATQTLGLQNACNCHSWALLSVYWQAQKGLGRVFNTFAKMRRKKINTDGIEYGPRSGLDVPTSCKRVRQPGADLDAYMPIYLRTAQLLSLMCHATCRYAVTASHTFRRYWGQGLDIGLIPIILYFTQGTFTTHIQSTNFWPKFSDTRFS